MHTPRPWRRRSPDLFRFPPLVCTSGWPNVAGLTLLRQLAAGGSRLHLHAGWDGPGLGIVQLLVARIGGEPWEMPPLQTRPARIRYEEDMRAELLAKVAEGWVLCASAIRQGSEGLERRALLLAPA